MQLRARVVLMLALTLSAWQPVAAQDAGAADVFTVGVIKDGPSLYFDDLVARVEKELNVLVEGERRVVFKHDREFSASWNIAEMGTVLGRALADPEVDLILSAGILVTAEAAGSDVQLTKPVVSGFASDPEVLGLPYNLEGYSTRTNMNFVIVPRRATRDVSMFLELVGFERLHVVADAKLMAGVKDIDKAIMGLGRTMGFDVHVVRVNNRAEDALAGLADNVQAVYLTPALRMPGPEWKKLIDELIARRIPTFSMGGHRDVKLGVLAGLQPEVTDRLARRLALNLQQVMLGASPNDLAVGMTVKEVLLLNMRTARALEFYPDFRLLMSAETLHPDMAEGGEKLTLARAVKLAVAGNVDLAVNRAEVEGSRQDQRKARTALFPQVDGSASYYRIDSDRAEASLGTQPEEATALRLSLSQLVFSDPAITRLRASSLLYQKARFERNALELDVALRAAKAFIRYLSQRELLRIEDENLRLMRSFLELARIRHEAGTSGPEEIYRWEAEVAARKGSVIEADSRMSTALVALNQALGVSLDRRWRAEDVTAPETTCFFMRPDLDLEDLISNMIGYRTFIQYGLETGVRTVPELKALDSAVAAQRVVLSQLKRRFVLPDVGVSASYDRTVDETVAGMPPGGASSSAADDDDWRVAVSASWPLFEGGGKAVDIAAAEAELQRLVRLRERAQQLVEQRIYSTMYAAGSTHPNIQLTRRALEMARKNLEVIQDKYARGAVSILELLDAQNKAFLQERADTLAVYEYFDDIIEAQHAIGFFEELTDEQTMIDWINGLKARIQQVKTDNRERRGM